MKFPDSADLQSVSDSKLRSGIYQYMDEHIKLNSPDSADLQSVSDSKLRIGIYQYMDEHIKLNSSYELIDLSKKENITTKKIPFSKFFLLNNTILRITTENKFEITQSNGYSRTYKYFSLERELNLFKLNKKRHL